MNKGDYDWIAIPMFVVFFVTLVFIVRNKHKEWEKENGPRYSQHKITKVFRCNDDTCRVEMEDGRRVTTPYLVAEGDLIPFDRMDEHWEFYR